MVLTAVTVILEDQPVGVYYIVPLLRPIVVVRPGAIEGVPDEGDVKPLKCSSNSQLESHALTDRSCGEIVLRNQPRPRLKKRQRCAAFIHVLRDPSSRGVTVAHTVPIPVRMFQPHVRNVCRRPQQSHGALFFCAPHLP